MKAAVYTGLFVIVPTLGLWYAHRAQHGEAVYNWQYLAITLFCVINSMIAVWEMALYLYQPWITSQFSALKKKYEAQQLPPVFMFQHVDFAEAISIKYWANVWLLYSFFDQSYSDERSYGFWIDAGNGFTTLIPSIVFALGLTYDVMDPKHLGVLGLILFYQEFYGTVLYFSSFFHNKRWTEHGWTGRGKALALVLVLVSNGIWFAGPSLGMWISYRFVMDGRPAVDLLRSTAL